MNRITLIAITVATTLALSAGAVLTLFSVLPAEDGDGFVLVSRKQAQECADGGGCSTYSARQITIMFLRVMQEHSGQQPQRQKPGLST